MRKKPLYSEVLLFAALSLAMSVSCRHNMSILSKGTYDDPEFDRSLEGLSIEEQCLKGYKQPDLSVEDVNSVVYRLALERGEVYPEMATPTLKIVDAKKGRFDQGLVYTAVLRNILQPDKPIEHAVENREADPSLAGGRLECLNYNRDGHGHFLDYKVFFRKPVVDLMQFEVTQGRYTFPGPGEFQQAIRSISDMLPSWNQPAINVGLIKKGKQVDPKSYVKSFIGNYRVPWGENGWMFYHDLLIHVQTMFLLPPKIIDFVRSYASYVDSFIEIVDGLYPNKKELVDRMYLRLADGIDLWSFNVLNGYLTQNVSASSWYSKPLSMQRTEFMAAMKADPSLGHSAVGAVHFAAIQQSSMQSVTDLLFNDQVDYDLSSTQAIEVERLFELHRDNFPAPKTFDEVFLTPMSVADMQADWLYEVERAAKAL